METTVHHKLACNLASRCGRKLATYTDLQNSFFFSRMTSIKEQHLTAQLGVTILLLSYRLGYSLGGGL